MKLYAYPLRPGLEHLVDELDERLDVRATEPEELCKAAQERAPDRIVVLWHIAFARAAERLRAWNNANQIPGNLAGIVVYRGSQPFAGGPREDATQLEGEIASVHVLRYAMPEMSLNQVARARFCRFKTAVEEANTLSPEILAILDPPPTASNAIAAYIACVSYEKLTNPQLAEVRQLVDWSALGYRAPQTPDEAQAILTQLRAQLEKA